MSDGFRLCVPRRGRDPTDESVTYVNMFYTLTLHGNVLWFEKLCNSGTCPGWKSMLPLPHMLEKSQLAYAWLAFHTRALNIESRLAAAVTEPSPQLNSSKHILQHVLHLDGVVEGSLSFFRFWNVTF